MQRSFQHRLDALTEYIRSLIKVNETTRVERLPTSVMWHVISLEIVFGEHSFNTRLSLAQSTIRYSSLATPAFLSIQGSATNHPIELGDVPLTIWPRPFLPLWLGSAIPMKFCLPSKYKRVDFLLFSVSQDTPSVPSFNRTALPSLLAAELQAAVTEQINSMLWVWAKCKTQNNLETHPSSQKYYSC